MTKPDNAMLALTGNGMKAVINYKEGFYCMDNENLDAPDFVPTGATYSNDKCSFNGVVIYRSES